MPVSLLVISSLHPFLKALLLFLLIWSFPASAVELRIGVISERVNQPDYVIAQYQRLLDLLRQRLLADGIHVNELVVARDLADMAAKIRRREVDMVMESLFPLLWLETQGVGLDLALAAWRKGRRESRSVFFVAQNSEIRSLDDLGGKILVLETPRSTTAYALPRMALADSGFRVVPRDDMKVGGREVGFVLAGDEVNEAYWVAHGKADAGAFNSEDWDELPDNLRRQLKIIHTTAPILRWLVAYRARLPYEVRERVNAELLALEASAEGQRALAAMRGTLRFDMLSQQDRNAVRRWREIGRKSGFGR
jgi:phosphonate transport system substrate-binding protein